jgi:hypothetical protein
MTSPAKAAMPPSSSDPVALADWDNAPGLLEGATSVEIDPRDCGVDYWLKNVAQGPLVGLVRGHKPQSQVPQFLKEPGPLRDSLISEFAFRSLTEEAATRACALVAAASYDVAGLEFYTTQALDEARHAQTFREHLLDLGVPADELRGTIEAYAGADRDRILGPLWEWGLPAFADKFVNGVAIVTVLLEGVLAPTTELSERKWTPLSQATTDVERGACVDEIRHLAAGSWFIREHLRAHPEDHAPLIELVLEGRRRWDELPTVEVIAKREALFQEGLEAHAVEVGDYEIFPGRRLIDTDAQERLLAALKWSQQVQAERLAYMGLQEVIPDDSQPVPAATQAQAG